jgi:hypothetical protein
MLRHLTSSADTALPLLVEHSKADIRLNTSGERLLGALSNSPERLRAARITFPITRRRKYKIFNRLLLSGRCALGLLCETVSYGKVVRLED